jgi:hypothetical protein
LETQLDGKRIIASTSRILNAQGAKFSSSHGDIKNKFSNRIGTRYVLHTKDIKVDGDIIYLPIYMAMFL